MYMYSLLQTCREDGLVQVWDILKGGHHLSSLHLGRECTGLACPISSETAVVGTRTGHLLLISFTGSMESPRLVYKIRLFKNEISILK